MRRHDRIAIASRFAAAIVGGYALTWLVTACLSLWLPLVRTEAVLTASMLSFAIYIVIAIAVFRARTATRAWMGLLIAAVPCGILLSVGLR